MRIWPRVPDTVLGREIPRRFRRARVHFVDGAAVLADFAAWLESETTSAASWPIVPETSPGEGSGAQHKRLVLACIELRDLLPGDALRAQLMRALQEVGVEEVVSDGEEFDPERHHAVGRVAAPDPSLHNRVAETQRPGYRDRDGMLALPHVLVYRKDAE